MSDVLMRLCKVAAEETGKPLASMSPSTRIIEDLDFDSLAILEFLMAVEDEFGIPPLETAGRDFFVGPLKTLGDLERIVTEALDAPTPASGKPFPHGPVESEPAQVPFTHVETNQPRLFEKMGTNDQGFAQFRRKTDGMRCILIPECTVTIGIDGARPEQAPAHPVRLSSYLIDAEPVSNAAFVRFLNEIDAPPRDLYGTDEDDKRKENLAIVPRDGLFQCVSEMEDHPVVMVSWFGANAYSLWANGLDWRDAELSMLPSEAQWENAARGATNGWAAKHKAGETYSRVLPTAPVTAHIGASEYGLLHMSGNVWEWCRDWYDPHFYSHGDQMDPVCICETGIRSERGGSWVGPSHLADVTYRRGRPPGARGRCLGFRCIGTLPGAVE